MKKISKFDVKSGAEVVEYVNNFCFISRTYCPLFEKEWAGICDK